MPRRLTRPAALVAAGAGIAATLAAAPAVAASHVTPRPTAPKKVVCPTVPAGAARTAHLAVQTLQATLHVARTGTLWPVADAATWTALRARLAAAGVTTGANALPSASPSASASATATSAASGSANPAPSASASASAAPSASSSGAPTASPGATPSPTPGPTGPVIDGATWAALGLSGAACPAEPKPGPHGPRTGIPDIDPGLIARVVTALTPPAWPVVSPTSAPAPTANLLGRAAARAALAELGVPYRWGGTGIGGWDCSGLVQHAYATVGIVLPRVTSTQVRTATRVPLAQARMGDLVFWATDPTDAWDVYHVGIYLGSGLVVEAPYTGAKVRITPLRSNALVGQVIRPTAALRWPVAPNTTSSTVGVLQRLLRVPVTGTADATTVAAVQAAQQKAGLSVTGTADEVLAAWLAMGARAGDGPHVAAELVLPGLKPKMARVPGTGPATARLPRRAAPKPSPSPSPSPAPSPSSAASSPAGPSPSPPASPSPSPSPH